jgi:NAD(P)-dependent dehydrogenase (short-subunit alcohol dehydrogenase family)
MAYALFKDGIEAQFQTNHLGHFAFTIPLLPLLIKTSKVIDSSTTFYRWQKAELVSIRIRRAQYAWSTLHQQVQDITLI